LKVWLRYTTICNHLHSYNGMMWQVTGKRADIIVRLMEHEESQGKFQDMDKDELIDVCNSRWQLVWVL
jgi:hypothetical protein